MLNFYQSPPERANEYVAPVRRDRTLICEKRVEKTKKSARNGFPIRLIGEYGIKFHYGIMPRQKGDIIRKRKSERGFAMKLRKKEYGRANIIGRKAEALRKERKISQKDFIAQLQTAGLDINPTSYSKLEGQIRSATDKEVFIIAKVLKVDMRELFDEENSEEE